MSLEEFLGDDTLGDSVWNEDEINLDAITNTTNIDFLKNKSGTDNYDSQANPHNHNFGRGHNQNPFDYHNKGGYGRDHEMGESPSSSMHGPPYIVKFSQLPPKFSDGDIHDLFHEKFTKFVKFKLFWELNKNPSIDMLKSGSVFDLNFKRVTKVGFVELYTGRDMDKILKYWSAPLLKIHNIKVEAAEFADFKEYMTKVELLTDPKDDAGKPYVMPRKKSNPFGAAKPVDTQSKILAIEDKVGKLHIEDTKTLRRLSEGESVNPVVLKPGKVHILKKPLEEMFSKEDDGDNSKKPLRYVDVMKKSGEELKKGSPPTSKNSTALPSPKMGKNSLYSNDGHSGMAGNPAGNDPTEDLEGSSKEGAGQTPSDMLDNITEGAAVDGMAEHERAFTFKDSERNHDSGMPRQSYPDQRQGRGGRGGGYSRGNANGTYRRGGRGGANRGGSGSYQSRFNNQNEDNENENYQSRKFNNNKTNQPFDQNQNYNGSNQNYSNSNSNQQQNQGYNPDAKRYSMFKPASGFLWENGKNISSGNQNSRGGFNNHSHRGTNRGGFNNRNRHNNGFTPA